MANLKDIRTRINSVQTTRQVTSAMKMVSAAKLKKSQDDISHIRPYTMRLASIIQDLRCTSDYDISSCVFTKDNKGDKTIIIVVASNRGLCGAFNSNVVKAVQTLVNDNLKEDYKNGKVVIGVLGKQAEKMLKSRNIKTNFEYNDYILKPSYAQTRNLANKLLDGFTKGEYKKVYLVYNEFVNAAVQNVQSYQFLPFTIPVMESGTQRSLQYLLEPDADAIINSLIPEMLHSMLFQVILESQASENGARMTSMHKATDNATELINDLQLVYNKARQTAITNEIIEVTSGADALSG